MNKKKINLRKYFSLQKLTHGLISGAADNDPAGISTYSIVGATTGFSQLWLVVLSTPLLINIQSICAKIGDVKKQGLAQIITAAYGKKVAIVTLTMLIIGNLTTLGANFAAIAAAFHLLFPAIDTLFLLPLVTIFIWYLIVFHSYQAFAKFLILLSLIFAAYIITGFLVRPDWLEVARATFFPHIPLQTKYWLTATAFLGTTITPFLFYWQVTQEIEDHPSVKDIPHETAQNSWGFVFSNLVSYFIIITTATLFYTKGLKINTSADAARALVPLMGRFAEGLFAIGIIGAGLLAVPVLASTTAYAIAETFGWKKGLNFSLKKAKAFYTTLSATFLIGLAISFSGWSPIKALFYSQVVNGILAPFLIIIIILLANNPNIVGRYASSKKQNFLGLVTVAIMLIAVLGSLIG